MPLPTDPAIGYCAPMVTATDPTPFLSTIAGASSGLVAIVGGLLVARFVSLDSEQQGAQRVLDDAEARLAIAQQRARDAADRLLRWDVQVFSDNWDVVEAILEGVTDLAELRRQGGQTRLTDEQLARLVEEVRRELARAQQVLESTVPASEDVERASWDDFRRSTPGLPETNWELAWEVVFHRICERRAADRKATERARAAERARSASFPAFALPEFSVPEGPIFSPRVLAGLKPLDRATQARRRDELMAAATSLWPAWWCRSCS